MTRVAGVHDADVSYETGRAVVRYDTTATSPEQFIAELRRLTGFTARVIPAATIEPAPPAEP